MAEVEGPLAALIELLAEAAVEDYMGELGADDDGD